MRCGRDVAVAVRGVPCVDVLHCFVVGFVEELLAAEVEKLAFEDLL
jgi:hypothetical protein